jgi:hypothetical protein
VTVARRDLEQLELKLKERANELGMAQQIISVAYKALSGRMLTAFALVADCVLFGWALAVSGWQALAAAVLFAIASWCVLHLRFSEKREEEP